MTVTPSAPGTPMAAGPSSNGAQPNGRPARPVLSTPALGDVPPSASARRLLRNGLPAIYQESPDPFAMLFLEALERVLDPRVAIIDNRASYIARDLAPEDMVYEMARWLGLEPEELPPGVVRAALEHAGEITRLRGTLRGLELSLRACFPDLHFRLHDAGKVVSAPAPEPSNDTPGLRVRCREVLEPQQQAALARVIKRQLPVHVEVEVLHGDESVPLEENA